tara:strand:- start:1192 stop:2619 length:1428 start_codon:yes stop_codon:yes gene_type:complete
MKKSQIPYRGLMSIQKKTFHSFIWSFIEQIGIKGITGAVTIILAKFLNPEDFGLIAMLTVFIQIANSLMDFGLNQALIRKDGANETDYSTVFFTNVLFGVTAYSILFFFSTTIANFYQEQRLVFLIRIIGITIIINSFKIVQETKLTKALNFKGIVKVTFPASLISCIFAVSLAYYGYGIWALVIQMLSSSFLSTSFMFLLYRWVPKAEFSILSFKENFNFGFKLALSQLVDIIFQNIFVIVIAKYFSAQEAGYYFFAHRLRQFVIFQFNIAVQKVSFPALSLIQNDNLQLKIACRKLMNILTLIIFPVVIFSASLGTPLFHLFLSKQWSEAVPVFQLLFIAGLIVPMHSVNINILKIKGRTDIILYLELIKKTIIFLVLLITTQYGVIIILYGQIFTSFINYIPNVIFSKKLINYSVWEQFSDVFMNLVLSLTLGCALHQISKTNVNALYQIFLFGSFACIIYILSSRAVSSRS